MTGSIGLEVGGGRTLTTLGARGGAGVAACDAAGAVGRILTGVLFCWFCWWGKEGHALRYNVRYALSHHPRGGEVTSSG